MAQIPEVGSVWVNDYNSLKSKVVFADDEIVVVSFGVEGKGRQMVSADDFAKHFKPAPRKVKYQRWVNLYADGSTSSLCKSKEEADGLIYTGCETRLIEWEVEE